MYSRGRYTVRFAESAEDIRAAQRLRFRCFVEGKPGARADGLDVDAIDETCSHVLIETRAEGALVACFRLLTLESGADIASSYSAQFYDLDALRDYPDAMVEMGRFCVAPGLRDPEIIRCAWMAMTRYVREKKIGMLFGCSSFHGVDAAIYEDAFALLKDKHLAPKRFLPRVKAPRVFRFAAKLGLRRPNMKLALRRMPPLLRSYLLMGGWVSDHAVIDHDLNTLHVFTGVEVKSVPPGRVKLLERA